MKYKRIHLIYIALFIYSCSLSEVLEKKVVKFSENSIPAYDSLFNSNIQSQIKHLLTTTSVNKRVISQYEYAKKFTLLLQRIDSNINNLSIEESISEMKESELFTVGMIYNDIQFGVVNYLFQTDSICQVKKIQLLYTNGNLTTLVKNDSLAYYSFNSNAFALKYNRNSYNDINLINKKNRDISMIIFKRKFDLFLAILINDNNVINQDKDLLYNIFFKNI